MAIEGVVEFAFGAIRFVAACVTDVIAEKMCKGLGIRFWKLFDKSIDPDGIAVYLTGFIFWVGIFIAGIVLLF